MDNIRKVVTEELSKVFKEDVQSNEAEISSAISFMQDLHSSMNKLNGQKKLKTTSEEVDMFLNNATESISKALSKFLENLSPEVKNNVLDRFKEINI